MLRRTSRSWCSTSPVILVRGPRILWIVARARRAGASASVRAIPPAACFFIYGAALLGNALRRSARRVLC